VGKPIAVATGFHQKRPVAVGARSRYRTDAFPNVAWFDLVKESRSLKAELHAISPRNIYRKKSLSWGLYQFYLFQLMNALPVWLMAESLLYSRSTIRKP
jgi:hypothetical protein